MSLNITNYPSVIRPAYAPLEFTLIDSSTTRLANPNLYYQLKIYVDGYYLGPASGERTLKVLPKDYSGFFDVQGIIQQFFRSNIGEPLTGIDGEEGVIKYDVVGSSFIGTSEVSSGLSGFYAFNGVDKGPLFKDGNLYAIEWDEEDYAFDPCIGAGSDFKFLNKWSGRRKVHIEDNLYVSHLYGNFETFEVSTGTIRTTIDASWNGIEIKTYTTNGVLIDTSTYSPVINTFNDPTILRTNIGPAIINTDVSGFIDENVSYYTIQEKTGLSEIITVEIVPVDSRFPKYYRIAWLDGFGALNMFNFDLNPGNSISISKDVYSNDNDFKSYNTKVSDSYNILTNWITEEESNNLKELWFSPNVVLEYGVGINYYEPIVLSVTSKDILNRRNVGLINYNCSFIPSQKYVIQAQ